jgi:ParB family chromosome partitioning protein
LVDGPVGKHILPGVNVTDVKALEIQMVDIDKIIPNPKNANRHSVEQIQRLEKLITKIGFRVPLIVSKRTGFLVSGHGRLEAAKNLGMKVLPVDHQEFESEAIEYAFLVSDNEIARWAELDKQSVYENLAEMQEFDIELLGIEDFKLFEIEDGEMPTLGGEKPELEQMTFTLHNSQIDTVKAAMELVKTKYPDYLANEFNENRNGNAIAYICELFITQNQ